MKNRCAHFWKGTDLRRLVPLICLDLMICDLKMPGEHGLSLTRRLRTESHAAVLMLTGMGPVLDWVVGLEMWADDYLGKPFEPVELRGRIKAVLRRIRVPVHANGRRQTASASGAVWSMSNKRRCSTMAATRSR